MSIQFFVVFLQSFEVLLVSWTVFVKEKIKLGLDPSLEDHMGLRPAQFDGTCWVGRKRRTILITFLCVIKEDTWIVHLFGT